MKIQSNEIGFDLDGVIADIGEAFLRLACEEFDYCSFRLEEITNFQVEQCLDMDPTKVEQIFHAILQDSIGTGLQPLPGAVEVLSALASSSPVTIITARPIGKPVEDWLQHYFPASTCNNITLVAMGDHDDKARYIKDHDLHYFIDDRTDTCMQLTEQNITAIIYNQPWNQKKYDLPNVNNWQEIKKYLAL